MGIYPPDLKALAETKMTINDETHFLRSLLRGTCHEVLRAALDAPNEKK